MTKRERMGEHIVLVEGRFDKQGRLLVYQLPAGDGGGSFEVAGINEKYHRAKATELRNLIRSGQHAKAKKEAARYIMAYTDKIADWIPAGYPQIEMILRDAFFNRGGRGAAAILQIALGVTVDGKIGPATKRALATALAEDANRLAILITASRASYEKRKFAWKPNTRDEKSKFWRGLSNRWANTHKAAMALVA